MSLNINARVKHKHGTEANWEMQAEFIPMDGEIIIYDEDENYDYKRIKIGNGVDDVNDLDFVVHGEYAKKTDIPSIEGLATESYVNTKVDELFQSVSNGKELIASAITDKGVYASDDDTFRELSDKIGLIPVGPPGSNIIGYIDEENDIYVALTELENGIYTLKFENQDGSLEDFDDIGTVEVNE